MIMLNGCSKSNDRTRPDEKVQLDGDPGDAGSSSGRWQGAWPRGGWWRVAKSLSGRWHGTRSRGRGWQGGRSQAHKWQGAGTRGGRWYADRLPGGGSRDGGFRLVSLVELRAGEKGIVADLRTDDNNTLRKLMSMGILPGMSVRVMQTFPSHVLQVGYTQAAVDREIASAILVEPDWTR